MAFVLPNLAYGLVSGSFTNSQTTIDLEAGDGAVFGSSFNMAGILWNWTDFKNPAEARRDGTLDYEFILITGRTGDQLTVSRGQESTSGITSKTGRTYRIAATGSKAFYDAILEGAGGITTITTTTYTVASGVKYVKVDDDTAAATVTITLPTAAGNEGRPIKIKKLGTTASVVVDGDGAETIDGQLTQTIVFQYDAIEVVSDGTNWSIF